MNWVRLSKAVLALVLGSWALLVVYGNIADYGTNWTYIQKVMSMEAVQNDPNVSWRAADSLGLQRLAYAAIILGEAVVSVMFLFAGALMVVRLGGPTAEFRAAKVPFAIGLTVAILVWLFGFMVVAGEWFQMWRSSTYNAQQAAFTFYMTIVLSAVYIFQDETGL